MDRLDNNTTISSVRTLRTESPLLSDNKFARYGQNRTNKDYSFFKK